MLSGTAAMPLAENMINGEAFRPGDILTSRQGTTVEIANTDAEGRLILADALAYTVDKYKPDYMVNLATLTGACIVALGHHMAAIMSKDDELIEALNTAGDKVHERLWRMPLNEEFIIENFDFSSSAEEPRSRSQLKMIDF